MKFCDQMCGQLDLNTVRVVAMYSLRLGGWIARPCDNESGHSEYNVTWQTDSWVDMTRVVAGMDCNQMGRQLVSRRQE